MRIGILKSYILHKESKKNTDFYILKIDSSDEVLLQAEKNNKLLVSKRLSNIEKAKKIIEAVVGRDQPRAFDKDSPSNSPFSNNGGGGLLEHVENQSDKNEELKNRKNKLKKTKQKNKSRNRENWHDPDGNDESYYSLVSVEFGRDYSKDEDGFDNALEDKPNGMRPEKPKSEFSPDIQEKPQEYKPNYDHSYGTDNPQNYEDRAKKNIEKSYNLRKERQKEKEQFIVYYEENGQEKQSRPVSLEDANKIKMNKYKSRIKRK